MTLYHLTFKVRPSVDHPKYYEWSFGFLSIWIFGSSDEDAVDRGGEILDQLPYETVGEITTVREPEPDPGGVAGFIEKQNVARQIGIAFQLHGVATGADEPPDFEEMPAP